MERGDGVHRNFKGEGLKWLGGELGRWGKGLEGERGQGLRMFFFRMKCLTFKLEMSFEHPDFIGLKL